MTSVVYLVQLYGAASYNLGA